MATKIVTKNSSTASAVPTASDLVQGELAVNVADKRLFTEDNGGSIVELGTNPSGNVTFQDNGKAIFGAGSDLQIYHDGANSYVTDAGTGDLRLSANNLRMQNADNTVNYIKANNGSNVELFFNNASKLATTSTGIDVTGTATMDGLTVTKASGDIATLESTTAAGDVQANLVFNPVYDVNARIVSAREGAALASTLSFETGVDNTGSTVKRQLIASNGDISFYEDTGTTPKFFWDASAESLGIGTSSPSSYNSAGDNLVIAETTGGAGLTLASSTTGSGHILFADGTSGTGAYDGFIRFDHTTSSMRFASGGGAERMRIDSSGNLLVGKTNTTFGTVGVENRGDGRITSTRSGNTNLLLNRLSTDGDIVEFYKDGAPVGNIGTISGDFNIYAAEAGHKGLRLGAGFVAPTSNSTALQDNTTDLGISNARFRNLYLAGGVQLGGTGAANKLDDYEEGTWTPVAAGSTTAGTFSASVQTGTYTKVGRIVTFEGLLNATSFNGAGNFTITGLPLSPISGSVGITLVQANTTPWATLSSDNQHIVGNVVGTTIEFRTTSRILDGGYNRAQCSGSTIGYLRLSGTYITTA